jgi:micrococcal nuclease
MKNVARIYILGLVAVLFLPSGTAQKTSTVVSRIVDGDTITLVGYSQNFRLIGIDTPESRNNARAKSQAARANIAVSEIVALGKKAKGYTEKLLKGKPVEVEWDIVKKDRYGRYLAYIWINQKQASIEIARAGWAESLTIVPNVKYAEQISKAVGEARAARRGIWQ